MIHPPPSSEFIWNPDDIITHISLRTLIIKDNNYHTTACRCRMLVFMNDDEYQHVLDFIRMHALRTTITESVQESIVVQVSADVQASAAVHASADVQASAAVHASAAVQASSAVQAISDVQASADMQASADVQPSSAAHTNAAVQASDGIQASAAVQASAVVHASAAVQASTAMQASAAVQSSDAVQASDAVTATIADIADIADTADTVATVATIAPIHDNTNITTEVTVLCSWAIFNNTTAEYTPQNYTFNFRCHLHVSYNHEEQPIYAAILSYNTFPYNHRQTLIWMAPFCIAQNRETLTITILHTPHHRELWGSAVTPIYMNYATVEPDYYNPIITICDDYAARKYRLTFTKWAEFDKSQLTFSSLADYDRVMQLIQLGRPQSEITYSMPLSSSSSSSMMQHQITLYEPMLLDYNIHLTLTELIEQFKKCKYREQQLLQLLRTTNN